MQNPDTSRGYHLALLIIRSSVGILLLFHGIGKLSHGHDFIRSMLAEKGLPQFFWLGVPLTEVLAPLLLLLGAFTRIAGAGIAILMIMTVILAHMPTAFTIAETGGLEIELNLLYLSGGLALFFAGPGKFSVYRAANYWLQ